MLFFPCLLSLTRNPGKADAFPCLLSLGIVQANLTLLSLTRSRELRSLILDFVALGFPSLEGGTCLLREECLYLLAA